MSDGFYNRDYALQEINVPTNDVSILSNSDRIGSDVYGFVPAGNTFGGSAPFNSDFPRNLLAAVTGSIGAFASGVGGGVASLITSIFGAAVSSYDSTQYKPADPNFGYGTFYPGTAPSADQFVPIDSGYGISDPGQFQPLYYPQPTWDAGGSN